MTTNDPGTFPPPPAQPRGSRPGSGASGGPGGAGPVSRPAGGDSFGNAASSGGRGPDATGGPGDGPGAKERAQQAAGTAKEEAGHVANTAQEQARQVADEAKSQARGLVNEAMGQVDDQARTQRDRLVSMLGSLGDDLGRMSGEGEGLAADLTQEASDRARALATRLDGREPSEILDDIRHFARRRPAAFLLGSLAAGVVVGRLTRGARDASTGSGSSPSPASGRPGTPVTPRYDDRAVLPEPALDDTHPDLRVEAKPTFDPGAAGGAQL